MKRFTHLCLFLFLSISIFAQVDVSIRKTLISPPPFQYGNIVAFSVEVTNNGTVPVKDIVIRDILPCGVTYVGDINIWSPLGNDRVITIPNTLNPGNSTMVGIDMRLQACTLPNAWLNTVEIISFSNLSDVNITNQDVNPINNTAEELIPIYDLALTKKLITPQPYTYGSELIFEIEVFNQGNQTVNNINILDYFPLGNGYGYNPASNPGWNGMPPTLNRTITQNVLPGTSTKVQIRLILNPTNGGERVWVNYAEIGSARDEMGNPIFDADSTPGSNSFIERDILPGSPDDDNLLGGGLAMGEDEDDHDPAGALVFDLALTKTQGSALLSFSYLQEVEYVFTIVNQGSTSATNIVINDYLPPALTYINTSKNMNRGWSYNNLTKIAKLTYTKVLLPGQSDTLKLDLVPIQWYDNPDDAWTDYAEISSAQIPGVPGFAVDLDSTPDDIWNNDAGGLALSPSDGAINGDGSGFFQSADPLTDEDDHDPHKIQIFDLALESSVATPGTYFTPGTDITFEIILYNQGNVVAKNIILSNYIPKGFEFISIPQNTGWSGNDSLINFTWAPYLYPSQHVTIPLVLRMKSSADPRDYYNYTEISAAQDTVNNNRNDDADSIADYIRTNDNQVEPESADDDNILGNSFFGGDEDDHDVAAVKLLCIKPTLTVGIPVCSQDNTYSVLFYSNVNTISADFGTIGGSTITNIPIGNHVTVTATNGENCTQTLVVMSPTSCNVSCEFPKLTAGQPLCTANNTYAVSFSNDLGNVSVSFGTISGNSVINIPIGTNIIITATNGNCVSRVSIESPTDCDVPCANSPISISGPICDNNGTYRVNFITTPGTNVTSSIGTLSSGTVSNIPSGMSVTLTVTNQGCENRIINVPPSNCVLSNGGIGKIVWHDTNGDGQQSANEPGIAGVAVTLFDKDKNQIATTTTATNGSYSFTNVRPGEYYIKFGIPTGFTTTFANIGNDNTDSDITGKFGEGTTSLFTVVAGSTNNTIDAGFYICIPIGDLVWYDINRNDLWDNNENGLNGLRVNLWRNHFGTWLIWEHKFTRPKPGSSSRDGYFNFCAPPGQYYLEVIMPTLGLVRARPNIGNNRLIDSDLTNANGPTTTSTFSVLSGQQRNDFGAGFYPMATAGNLVWMDANLNGIQDDGEDRVEGVKVEALEAITNTVVASTHTDADGYYFLDYLEQQPYYLKFTPPAGYSATVARATIDEKDSDVDHTHGYNTTRTIHLLSGEDNQNIDMGVAYGLLPVTWLWIKGMATSISNDISWMVSGEINVSHYEVERSSTQDLIFEKLGLLTTKPASPNATHKAEYRFEDSNIEFNTTYFYRVKQIDYDGKYTYSDIVKVQRNVSQSDFSIYPNPAKESINIDWGFNREDVTNIEFWDVDGKLMRTYLPVDLDSNNTNSKLNLEGLKSGIYNIKVNMNDQILTKKVIKID